MASVQVIQRHAHLAGGVRLEFVNGREGRIARAVFTAISNTRRASRAGEGETREEESTAIQWTLWGKQAENAAAYLGRGSHVNIVGRVRNNHYQDNEGADVYALAFTADEVDYLDSRADSEALRTRGTGEGANPEPAKDADGSAGAKGSARGADRTRLPRNDRQPARAGA